MNWRAPLRWHLQWDNTWHVRVGLRSRMPYGRHHLWMEKYEFITIFGSMLRGEPLGRHVKRIQYYPTESFIVWSTSFKRTFHTPIDIERLKTTPWYSKIHSLQKWVTPRAGMGTSWEAPVTVASVTRTPTKRYQPTHQQLHGKSPVQSPQ